MAGEGWGRAGGGGEGMVRRGGVPQRALWRAAKVMEGVLHPAPVWVTPDITRS